MEKILSNVAHKKAFPKLSEAERQTFDMCTVPEDKCWRVD
jgi:hypothetical protein